MRTAKEKKKPTAAIQQTSCLCLQWSKMNHLAGNQCCGQLCWHAGSCMARCLASRQLISPCYRLHPQTELSPGMEGTDSLPKSKPTEAYGLATNSLSQLYTRGSALQFCLSLSCLMFLCRERHILTDLGKCRWPGIIFPSLFSPC